jgi:hypothetical protein
MQYQLSRTLPDFDVLASLARQDPRALEDLGRRLTNEVIRHARSSQSRQRLRGLQFTIDLERKRAPDSLAACVRISQLMHESLAELNRAFIDPATTTGEGVQRSAKVLTFKPRAEDV